MDGEITIGTSLSTDKFDRQVAQLERKMQKEEEKKIVLQAKIEVQEEAFETARQKTDELADAYQRLEQLQKVIASGKATPQQFTMAQELQGTYGSLEQLEVSFLKALNKQDAINEKAYEMRTKYQEINDKVAEYKQKIESVQMQKQVSDVDRLKQSFNSVGSSIQNSIKSVARLALGVFGVRSAFMLLRQASSSLAGYDKQYAANIEYIRYALTQAIAPVLRWIVQMAATLLGYINAILNGWFGINLFSKGSAENFNKMKASTGGISKAVKEIKKQLAGFDEINMLTDQSDTGTQAGAGGVGTVMPDFDLSGLQAEKPAWLQWIIDNKDLVIGALAGIAAGLIALKLGASGLLALGIGVAVAGVVALIQDIIKFIKDPTWDNFVNIIRDLGIVLAGVGIAMVAINAANPVGWILLLIGVIGTITAVVIQNWDKVKQVLSVIGTWIMNNIINPIKSFFGGLWSNIKSGVNNLWSSVKGILSKVINWIKEHIINPIKNAFSNMWNSLTKGASNTWKGIKNVFSKVGSFFKSVYKTIKKILGKEIKVNIYAAAGGGKGSSGGGSGGGGYRAHGGIYYPSKLPKLASGGIINVPGRGVPYNGAIIGERGAEAVVPLTDNQQMELLGATIGKYITVNTNIVNTMNGRVISRELKQIKNEQDFAFNQ